MVAVLIGARNKKDMGKNNVRTTCKICGESKLVPFLDLGKTPLADRFVSDLQEKEPVFPLRVKVCPKCFLVQLIDEVDSSLLFGDDYAFYTSGSPSSIKYFKDYATHTMELFPKQSEKVLEIASNDGLLLKYFQEKGKEVLGIDPAKNVVEYANAQGIPTIADFFNDKSAKRILKKHGTFGLILANNVVAHVTDLHDFMKGVSRLLRPDGIFIFEVQYFPKLLQNIQFDNVYHEHRSFFSLHPLIYLMNSLDLDIFKVEPADTQGGSIRVYVTGKGNYRNMDEEILTMFDREIEMGINNIKTYKGFQKKVEKIRRDVIALLKKLKKQGKIVMAYGASAKGNTFLNYCGIGSEHMFYVVDKTPYKIGKFTPGKRLYVLDQNVFEGIKYPDYFLLLVWNYAEGVLKREKAFRKQGGKFIIAIPKLKIV